MAYGISNLALDVLDLLPQLSPFLTSGFILLGHSMRAKVAMAIAAQKPPGLMGMVLLCPAPPGSLVLPWEQREQQSRAYDTRDSARWTAENVLAEPDNLSEADMELIVRDSLAGNKYARMAWPRYGMAESVQIGMERRGLKVKVLVGREDEVEPGPRVRMHVAEVLAARGYDVELATVRDCGHLMPLEKPEAVASAVIGLCKELRASGCR